MFESVLSLADQSESQVTTQSGLVYKSLADHKSILLVMQIAGSAAGALQNVSREVASRMMIAELDVAAPLARLLSSEEVSVQVHLFVYLSVCMCVLDLLVFLARSAFSTRSSTLNLIMQRAGVCIRRAPEHNGP